MSDHEYDPDDDDATPAMKAMRDEIKRLKAEASTNAVAARENAFLKAGILDVEKGPGALLFKAYDGELDAEAIKAAALDFGVIQPEGSDATPPPPPVSDETDQRRSLGAGQSFSPGETPPTDLVDSGFAEFDRLLKQGLPKEDAFGAVIGSIFEAAREGDPRYNLSAG